MRINIVQIIYILGSIINLNSFKLQTSFKFIHKISYLSMNSLERVTIDPIKKFTGKITLPGSKSLSNRVLLLAALSNGKTLVENLLDSADIKYMLAGLKQLKVTQ